MHLPSLKDLLFRLADDLWLMSRQQLSWLKNSPVPQENLLLLDLAQAYAGQAQAYYGLLEKLGESSVDKLTASRAVEQFRSCHLVEIPSLDFGSHLMRNYLFEAAWEIRLASLVESQNPDLQRLAIGQQTHTYFSRGHSGQLVAQLGQAGYQVRLSLQTALNRLYPIAFGLFEPTVFSQRLANEGIVDLEDSLLKQWRSQTQEYLLAYQLEAPAANDFVDYFGGRSGHHTRFLQQEA